MFESGISVDEPGKSLNQRMSEHERAVSRMDPNNSLAAHLQSTLHYIDWDGATVLQCEQNRTRRKIKEAIHIRTTPCMNMDQGMHLDSIWELFQEWIQTTH